METKTWSHAEGKADSVNDRPVGRRVFGLVVSLIFALLGASSLWRLRVGLTMNWLTREIATELAQSEVERRGHTWREPIRVSPGLLTITVRVNAESRGGGIRVQLSRWTGEVRSFWVASR